MSERATCNVQRMGRTVCLVGVHQTICGSNVNDRHCDRSVISMLHVAGLISRRSLRRCQSECIAGNCVIVGILKIPPVLTPLQDCIRMSLGIGTRHVVLAISWRTAHCPNATFEVIEPRVNFRLRSVRNVRLSRSDVKSECDNLLKLAL